MEDRGTGPPKHVMKLPEVVSIGEGVLRDVGEEVARVTGPGEALVISGPHVWALFGDVVSRSLESRGFGVRVRLVSEADFSVAEGLADDAGGASVVVGLGGGKPIDVAKYVAYSAGVRMVSVPTSAAHDGIASPFASLRGYRTPYSMVTEPPKAVVADVSVIAKSPPRLIRSGVGDLLAKLTATRDWRLARKENGEYFGEYAAHLALLSARVVMYNSSRIARMSAEGVRTLVEALISAGVSAGIAGSSRPCSGSEHLISHALDLIAPGRGLHGEKVGIATIVAARLHGLNWRSVKRVLATVGAPTSFSELGISRDEVCRAIEMAPSVRPERFTILHKLRPSYDEACSLVDEVGVA